MSHNILMFACALQSFEQTKQCRNNLLRPLVPYLCAFNVASFLLFRVFFGIGKYVAGWRPGTTLDNVEEGVPGAFVGVGQPGDGTGRLYRVRLPTSENPR
jgi:hypothetical protein